MGHNMVPLLEDPEMTLGTGSFTAFVIVCRNDQLHKGCGSTAVLPRAHHLSEQFFACSVMPITILLRKVRAGRA